MDISQSEKDVSVVKILLWDLLKKKLSSLYPSGFQTSSHLDSLFQLMLF